MVIGFKPLHFVVDEGRSIFTKEIRKKKYSHMGIKKQLY
jgi:hypothetical protein